jgi:L-iditol 2-dehydrogenase
MMKALVKTQKGKGFLQYMDMPEPVPGAGEVKIHVKVCGICGTDLHIRLDEFHNFPPVILGHEFSGIVAELGAGVRGIEVGQRVVSEVLYQPCGRCRACKTGYHNLCLTRRGLGWAANGAFAPYTVVEAGNVHIIPDTVSFEEAALTEPLAVCACGVCELTGVKSGELVLVTGPGPIGLLTAQIATAEGGRVIVAGTGADAERLAVAGRLRIYATVNVQETDVVELSRSLTDGLGADVVFECSGAAQAARTGLEAVRKGGKYTQVGLFGRPIEVDMDQVALKELEVRGVSSSNWRGWDRGLRLMDQRQIELRPLISGIFPLSEWEHAFELAEKKQGLKILLVPEPD